MKILFIHDNFPAQFGAIGFWLRRLGWDVTFATAADHARAEGIRILPYKPHREPSAETHPYAQTMDRASINAQGFARAGFAAHKAGYRPDVIVSHSGWGAGMFARDVFPEAAYVAYCEWWYAHPGADITYLCALEGQPLRSSIEAPMLERARNGPILMDIAAADRVLCPTQFQASQFPTRLRSLLTVQHDGIDTDFYSPAEVDRTLGGLIPEDAHLVTYATRGMEPHRGFPQFIAALPAILAADPKAVVVIAGENRVAYGGKSLRGTDWKAKALEETPVDPARVHFVGRLPRPDYLRLLRRSDAHVYLTVPFVLSWSMLEAMSTGCPLILSDTAPVREYADEDCARLVDLAHVSSISQAVLATLSERTETARCQANARAVIENGLAIREIYPAKAKLFAEVAKGAG